MSLLLVEWCENAELNSIISGGRQELELVAGLGQQGQRPQDVGHAVAELESVGGGGGRHQGAAGSLLHLLQHALRVEVFSNFRKVVPNYAEITARSSREKQ